MATKVIHLTSVHRCDDPRIYERQCRTLARAGYEVILIAPDCHDRVKEGVCLRGVPKANGRLRRMLGTVYQVYRSGVRENGELYHLHDPELLGPAILLRMQGKKIIFDFHESLAAQVSTKPWVMSRLRLAAATFATFVEKLAIIVSNRVIAATPVIARSFPRNKTSVVMNYPILKEFNPTSCLPYSRRPPWIGYVGALTEIRGVKEMVTAMDLLPSHLKAKLFLVGTFKPFDFENEVTQIPGWNYVDYAGYQPRKSVVDILGQCRVGLVMLHPTPNYLESYPIKLYEYMAAGLPIIASDFPFWRKIIEDVGCGLLADPLDPGSIADRIQWILAHPKEAEKMGKRGLAAVQTRFNWNLEIPNLLRVYEEVLQ
ncbi:glycosyltransferase family 4 protein [Desulfomonile tiedjei]|uniref:Glycosyltransferase n=1 Tax=Desulfomonile tiedjei (strain ATCC 49306 / DSM 6799 / DCB-1) TaxID=706587 RepID=I4CBJ8_DESTA|nr:glycosyltransferase family 4 protein [Desulfomonile tiedjei]AFM26939.1 glycosyltransferase [Desulfomonile tiedjei DSM 6799]